LQEAAEQKEAVSELEFATIRELADRENRSLLPQAPSLRKYGSVNGRDGVDVLN
jgi:hypothetical protein